MSKVAGLIAVLDTALASPARYSHATPPPLPPDAVFPYITVEEIGGPDMTSMEGRTGASRKLMQVNCWDADYETAYDLREAVKEVLAPIGSVGYKGSAGAETILGTTHSSDHSLYDGVRELHQLITSFLIWWEA